MIKQKNSSSYLHRIYKPNMFAFRPNIYLDVKKVPADSMEESFDWYLDLLLKEKEKAPKAIIYAR